MILQICMGEIEAPMQAIRSKKVATASRGLVPGRLLDTCERILPEALRIMKDRVLNFLLHQIRCQSSPTKRTDNAELDMQHNHADSNAWCLGDRTRSQHLVGKYASVPDRSKVLFCSALHIVWSSCRKFNAGCNPWSCTALKFCP